MTENQIYIQSARSATSKADLLWNRYRATGEESIRNELVLMYMNLVEIIARKMHHLFYGIAQLDDIIGNGMIALIGAIESFDPARGVKFETYASLRIRGSVIDYIRSQDWVPRSSREKAKKLEESYNKLKDRLGREPTKEELSDDLQTSVKNVDAILSDAHAGSIISLEEMIADSFEGGLRIGEDSASAPHSRILKKELRKILAEAIDSLTEKERLVITLFY